VNNNLENFFYRKEGAADAMMLESVEMSTVGLSEQQQK